MNSYSRHERSLIAVCKALPLRLAFLLSLAVSIPWPALGAPVIGAYFWGGSLAKAGAQNSFSNSTAFLMNHGFHAIRVSIAPQAADSYGLDVSSCETNKSDACYLRLMMATHAFDDKRLSMLMVTLHEFTAGPTVW